MGTGAKAKADASSKDAEFFVGLARAAAGALIFGLPVLMTMEMWRLGFDLSPLRQAVLLAATIPVLAGLSRFGGFRPTSNLRDDLLDSAVALLVAFVVAVCVLALFGVIAPGAGAHEIVGKVTLQVVPGSIGAMLARSQLGEHRTSEGDENGRTPSYLAEVFLMAVGALFLSFNIAPTEEPMLISYKMNVWQELALAVLSLTVMHAFVYGLSFRGGSARKEGEKFLSLFARYTIVGYAVVLMVNTFVLWVFGQIDLSSHEEVLSAAVVLSFPGAVGAAAARLVL